MKNGSNRTPAAIPVMAALLAVFSWIAVPAAVPFTLQTMGVFLAAGLLGVRGGVLSVALYLLVGAAGLPVFSGFQGGVGALAGPTGGYLVGFLLTALLTGWITARSRRVWVWALGMAAGLAACYALGTAWFVIVYSRTSGAIGIGTALAWCVAPYLIPDGVKIVVSAVLMRQIRPVLERMGVKRW